MPVVSVRLFVKIARTLVALDHRQPRARPGAVEAERLRSDPSAASIRCSISSIVSSKTLTSPSSRGSSGWLPDRQGRTLAAEEPVDDRLGIRVVIHRRGARRRGRGGNRGMVHRGRSRGGVGRRARGTGRRQGRPVGPARARDRRCTRGDADGDQTCSGHCRSAQEPAPGQLGGLHRKVGWLLRRFVDEGRWGAVGREHEASKEMRRALRPGAIVGSGADRRSGVARRRSATAGTPGPSHARLLLALPTPGRGR